MPNGIDQPIRDLDDLEPGVSAIERVEPESLGPISHWSILSRMKAGARVAVVERFRGHSYSKSELETVDCLDSLDSVFGRISAELEHQGMTWLPMRRSWIKRFVGRICGP
jgi:hypothetical protein